MYLHHEPSYWTLLPKPKYCTIFLFSFDFFFIFFYTLPFLPPKLKKQTKKKPEKAKLVSIPFFHEKHPWNYKRYFYLRCGLKSISVQFLWAVSAKSSRAYISTLSVRAKGKHFKQEWYLKIYDFLNYLSKKRKTRTAMFLCLWIIQMLQCFLSE